MLGGIYGDKAGSIYEYSQIKEITSINPDKLITHESFFSDDTIEIIAIMDSILNKKYYGETLKKYILEYINYKPDYKPYFKYPFSLGTIKWAQGSQKNDSIGNGALMRISPVGYLFDNLKDIKENTILATIPSHNSKEAIECATKITSLIYYFRNSISKEESYRLLNLSPSYIPFKKFNTTCYETLNNCLYALYISNNFEDAIRKTLLMGGDTDTNCCIVGSMAEALYGMNEKENEDAFDKLPDKFVKVLRKKY